MSEADFDAELDGLAGLGGVVGEDGHGLIDGGVEAGVDEGGFPGEKLARARVSRGTGGRSKMEFGNEESVEP